MLDCGFIIRGNFECERVLFSMFEYRRNRSTRIHPDNRQDVELIRQRSENHGDSRNTSSRTHDDPCPICLNDSTVLTVQTNCGHKFCGNCIISYWKFQTNWMSGLTCPVCRQQVKTKD